MAKDVVTEMKMQEKRFRSGGGKRWAVRQKEKAERRGWLSFTIHPKKEEISKESKRFKDTVSTQLSGLLILFLLLICGCGNVQADEVDRIVDAIYKAEGGSKAKKPFGILSVPCEGYKECRQICKNTVINNRVRYQKYKKGGGKAYKDYIEFLASRYAPVGVKNDPTGLNKNWVKNVKYFIAKGE